jgi:transcriptional regulator with PAS, ATPase and Fis domain
MTLIPEAARALLQHPWDGNVRELENAIRRTVAMASTDIIRREDLILIASTVEGPHRLQLKGNADGNQSLEEKELEYIMSCLRENNWNCTRTAKELGIGRTTLWRKMKKIKRAEGAPSGVSS